MRIVIVVCSTILLSGLATAQARIIGGTAGDYSSPYIYAAPFEPLFRTPSVSFEPEVPMAAGARNATWGNVAGARNATTETLPPADYGRSWRERGFREAREERVHEMEPAPHEMNGKGGKREHHVFNAGASQWESEGLAEMTGKSSSAKKAARTYTNQDIQRMNDNNGNVKYDGKTEHI